MEIIISAQRCFFKLNGSHEKNKFIKESKEFKVILIFKKLTKYLLQKLVIEIINYVLFHKFKKWGYILIKN